MRGFFGAILNNLYMAKTKYLFLYIGSIAFGLIGFIAGTIFESENIKLSFYTILTLALITTVPSIFLESNQFSFTSRWSVFEHSMAVSPKTFIISRYTLPFVSSLISLGLVALIDIIIFGYPMILEEYLVMHNLNSFSMFIIINLSICVYFPIMYLFNPKKDASGQFILVISYMLAMVIFFAINLFSFLEKLHVVYIVFIILFYIISILITTAFYKRNYR